MATLFSLLDESTWMPLAITEVSSIKDQLRKLLKTDRNNRVSDWLLTKRYLSFMKDICLLRMQSPELEKQGARLYWFFGEGRLIRLDGNPKIVESLITMDGCELNADTVFDYLAVHAFFDRSIEHEAVIYSGVDYMEQFIHGAELFSKFIGEFPPKVLFTGPQNSYFIGEAPAIQDNKLWSSQFSITADGQIKFLWAKHVGAVELMTPVLSIGCHVENQTELEHDKESAIENKTESLMRDVLAETISSGSREDLSPQPILNQASDNDGLIVVHHIAPAESPELDDALKPYFPLLTIPCNLIGVPDLFKLRQALDGAFPWFSKLTTSIVNELAVNAMGNRGFHLSPLLIVGNPGLGKTAYLSFLFEQSGIPWRLLPLAGKSDNRDLAGTSRGWGSRAPGQALRLISESRVANIAMALDEIDVSVN